MPKTLRVLPRGQAMVPHYEHQHVVRKFHGWTHDPNVGEEYEDRTETGAIVKRRSGGFEPIEVSTDEHVIELPVTPEYIRHLRDGDFWAADEETARIAGCAFDPKFGGEHTLAPSVVVDVANAIPAQGFEFDSSKFDASKAALTVLPATAKEGA